MEKYVEFLLNSYRLLTNYEKKGRYFHTLHPEDNSPTVVHRQTNQYTYVIAGGGRVFLNGIECVISKGQGIFVEAGTCHRFLAVTEEMILFHIHIPDEGRESDRYIIQGEDYDRYEA